MLNTYISTPSRPLYPLPPLGLRGSGSTGPPADAVRLCASSAFSTMFRFCASSGVGLENWLRWATVGVAALTAAGPTAAALPGDFSEATDSCEDGTTSWRD